MSRTARGEGVPDCTRRRCPGLHGCSRGVPDCTDVPEVSRTVLAEGVPDCPSRRCPGLHMEQVSRTAHGAGVPDCPRRKVSRTVLGERCPRLHIRQVSRTAHTAGVPDCGIPPTHLGCPHSGTRASHPPLSTLVSRRPIRCSSTSDINFAVSGIARRQLLTLRGQTFGTLFLVLEKEAEEAKVLFLLVLP